MKFDQVVLPRPREIFRPRNVETVEYETFPTARTVHRSTVVLVSECRLHPQLRSNQTRVAVVCPFWLREFENRSSDKNHFRVL